MSIIQPLWEQILSDKGKKIFGLTTGPSIPFVVGVYHYYNKLSDKDLESKTCLQKVFSEILESRQGIAGVTICPRLGVWVLRNVTSKNHNPITSISCDSMIEKLWDEYGKFITTHRFSIDRIDHHWRQFDDSEIKSIITLKEQNNE